MRNVTFFAFSPVVLSVAVMVSCSCSFSKYIGISTVTDKFFPWTSTEEILSSPKP
ncbi:MAG: hypothetical protein MAG458_00192 [Nitrosopumilus sp.]|nr:hypothetical protein [Nitrosopumilus sp.]